MGRFCCLSGYDVCLMSHKKCGKSSDVAFNRKIPKFLQQMGVKGGTGRELVPEKEPQLEDREDKEEEHKEEESGGIEEKLKEEKVEVIAGVGGKRVNRNVKRRVNVDGDVDEQKDATTTTTTTTK